MKLIFDQLIIAFLILSMSMAASAKVGASASTKPETRRLNEQLDKFALKESIRRTVYQYNFVRTPAAFAKTFMSHFPERDQQLYQKTTKGISSLPKASIKGNSIILNQKGYETKLEFIPGKLNQFKINGYLWSYDPTIPLATQIEVLLKDHEPKKVSFHMLELLLPQAHAQLIAAGLGGAVITAVVIGIFAGGGTDIIKKLGEQAICAPTVGNKGPNSFQPRNVGFCEDWDTAFDKRQRKKAPHLDAIVKMIATDHSNVLAKFKVEKNISCPSNNDGKDRVYDANIKILDGRDKQVKVKVTLTPEGGVKTFDIFDLKNECKNDETKPVNDPDRKVCSLVTQTKNSSIDFDAENYMNCIHTKAATSDALTPEEVKLCQENANLSTVEMAKLALVQDLAVYTNTAITKCTVDAATQKVAEGKVDQIGSPAVPKPNDVALPPKQPAQHEGSSAKGRQ